HQLGVIFYKPLGAEFSTHFFIGCAEKNDIAIQHSSRTFDQKQGLQLGDRHALHVHGAASPELAVVGLSCKRWMYPVFSPGWYYIYMVQKDNRTLLAGALETGKYTGSLWRSFIQRCLDAILLQNSLQKLGTKFFVAGWNGRIDFQILRQIASRFRTCFVQVDS